VNDAIAPVIDPTIDPTKAPVERVLLPEFDEEDNELEAGWEEVCVADSWTALFVVGCALLPPALMVLVEGELVVCLDNACVVAAGALAVVAAEE
jgi:hypothetical protein